MSGGWQLGFQVVGRVAHPLQFEGAAVDLSFFGAFDARKGQVHPFCPSDQFRWPSLPPTISGDVLSRAISDLRLSREHRAKSDSPSPAGGRGVQ
jgi:hypothetical protein